MPRFSGSAGFVVRAADAVKGLHARLLKYCDDGGDELSKPIPGLHVDRHWDDPETQRRYAQWRLGNLRELGGMDLVEIGVWAANVDDCSEADGVHIRLAGPHGALEQFCR